jgi:hypothetical protein
VEAEFVGGAPSEVVSAGKPATSPLVEQTSAGLAALASERTLAGIYRTACVLAVTLPGVGGTASFARTTAAS